MMLPLPHPLLSRACCSASPLSQMADFYEDKQLTMKQFLVVLAIGYVLDAIPDLLEVQNQPAYGKR